MCWPQILYGAVYLEWLRKPTKTCEDIRLVTVRMQLGSFLGVAEMLRDTRDCVYLLLGVQQRIANSATVAVTGARSSDRVWIWSSRKLPSQDTKRKTTMGCRRRIKHRKRTGMGGDTVGNNTSCLTT